MQKLQAVPTTQPDAPYPDNLSVKGWCLTLDYERINQSDTWALAPPDMRPWLLMLWHVAWQQMPAGAFTNDDQVIAAKIGMDFRQFQAHRDILMRGWKLHSDGRLYHPALVEQVLAYIEKNRKARERVAAWRERQKEGEKSNADVTRNKRATNANVSVSTTPVPEPVPVITSSPDGEEESAGASPDDPNAESQATTTPPCPHKRIIELYHQHCPALPRILTWRGQRPRDLQARWRMHPDLDWWDGFLQYVGESKFLSGGNDRRWRADLEWIVKLGNFQKIVEGKYHR